MPELEEGNLWIRDTCPLNITLARQAAISKEARAIMASYPEVVDVVNQIGRTDDGTDTDGYYNSEFFVPLRPQKDWPAVVEQKGWRRWLYGPKRPRTKEELIAEMDAELERKLPGIVWNFSQNIRDNVMEALSGIKGDNSLKIIGPDFNKLQDLGTQAKNILQTVPGLEDVGIVQHPGAIAPGVPRRPGKMPALGRAGGRRKQRGRQRLGGQAMTQMIEGEKRFDVSIRWPAWRRGSETSILDIPVDVGNNQVVAAPGTGVRPLGNRDRPGPARGRRQPGRHRQSAEQHAAAAAARPGEPGRRGRGGRPERPVREARRRGDLPRTGKTLDRGEVQRSRPRPGRRGRRGAEEDSAPVQAPLSRRLVRRVRGNAGCRDPPDVDCPAVAGR